MGSVGGGGWLVSRLVPFLAETTTHKCAPRRAKQSKPNQSKIKTKTRTDHAGSFGIQLQRQRRERGQGGHPPLVRLKKYLGHLVSLDSREKCTWSLWAWPGCRFQVTSL